MPGEVGVYFWGSFRGLVGTGVNMEGGPSSSKSGLCPFSPSQGVVGSPSLWG